MPEPVKPPAHRFNNPAFVADPAFSQPQTPDLDSGSDAEKPDGDCN